MSALSDEVHTKLADRELLPKRESVQLKPWCYRYIASRTDLKPTTIKKYDAARDKLMEWPDIFTAKRTYGVGNASKWLAAGDRQKSHQSPKW
jgi:hypothetical protein